MENRPIGVFDSGLGGLTVLDALVDAMPNEKFIYLGDTANMPYGTKTKKELTDCVKSNMEFLHSFDVQAVVIACNTVDSVLGKSLKDGSDIPVFGVIAPAAAQAVHTTKTGKIGVIATNVAVESGAYEREIKKIAPDADVISIPCPRLVPLIESGHFLPGDELVVRALGDYLRPMKVRGVDTLILGCTHYPLLARTISTMLPGVTLVSSSKAAADAAAKEIAPCTNAAQSGGSKIFVTHDPEGFSKNAKMILSGEVEVRLAAGA